MLDSKKQKLIEHCENHIVACGVLHEIPHENIASMQDAIKKIADAYQVESTTGEGRKKFREGCQKAAYEYLKEEGIVTKDDVSWKNLNETDKVAYHIVLGKEQEYQDAIYRAEHQRKNTMNFERFLAATGGTEVCMGEDMLPGGPISNRKGKRTYAMMVQCLNKFEQETSDLNHRDFVENVQIYDR